MIKTRETITQHIIMSTLQVYRKNIFLSEKFLGVNLVMEAQKKLLNPPRHSVGLSVRTNTLAFSESDHSSVANVESYLFISY